MTVTCLGHSGMVIETDDATLIFDYYIDPAGIIPQILARAKRLYVFVSHSHRDHLNPEIFDWDIYVSEIQYIIANECRRKLARSRNLDAFSIHFLHHDEDWSDTRIAVRAFDSTDVGVSFLVSIGEKRVFHAGDYTCWDFSEEHDAATVRKARGDFHAILTRITQFAPEIDVAMMPVVPNIGGDWAYGAREFLKSVRVAIFIPMHMWGRDREATQWSLYQNPGYGLCVHVPAGQSIMV